MNNNQCGCMYAIVASILSIGGYLYNNVGLIAVAILALLLSIYASGIIKRKTED